MEVKQNIFPCLAGAVISLAFYFNGPALVQAQEKLEMEIMGSGEQAVLVEPPPTDFDILLQKAERGELDSQYRLGLAYLSGDGTHEGFADPVQAASWFCRAANRGLAEARYQLGQLYYDGNGVAQSHSRAFELFKMAADQAYAEAQYMLGLMYGQGLGVREDLAQAAAWMRKAAILNHVEAQVSLARMYEMEKGVPRSDAEAANWYRKAAEQGQPVAQYYLALLYGQGRGSRPGFIQSRRMAAKIRKTRLASSPEGIRRVLLPGNRSSA